MLCNCIEKLPEYRQLAAAVKAETYPAYVTGLSSTSKAHFIASLLESDRASLVLTQDEAAATRLCEDINSFIGGGAYVYPTKDISFYDMESVSREYEHARLKVLGLCMREDEAERCRVVVASAEAALQYTIPPDVLEQNTVILSEGDEIAIEELVSLLLGAGYQRVDQVEGVCCFSHRGGLVDVFPPDSPAPVRIEFWGDEIDSINRFDPEDQRRTELVDKITITPAREVLYNSFGELAKILKNKAEKLKGKQYDAAKRELEKDIERLEGGLRPSSADRYLPLIYEEPATLFNYVAEGFIFVSEFNAHRDNLKSLEKQWIEDAKLLIEDGILFKGCDTFSMDFTDYCDELRYAPTIMLDSFMHSQNELQPKALIAARPMQLSNWSGEISTLTEMLRDYVSRGYCCAVLAGTAKYASAVAEDLRRQDFNALLTDDVARLNPGSVYVIPGSISSGIEYPEIKFAIISHTKTTTKTTKRRRSKKSGEEIKSLSDLTPGDYVVHITHGIGIFEGIVKRDLQGVVKDYIKIRYAGTDALFIPVTQLDMVSKYIGPHEDSTVKLSKLNSAEWGKTRAKVKKAVKEMAGELIKLYSARMRAEGYPFSVDTDWQQDFEERFPYDETGDQLRCIEEIKHDMEQPRPMERLLCGDVGFGKTEVAIRAAFKCVMDSKQCAVLVPTTILAWQHYQTFLSRMDGFPIKVEMLSRFRTPKQQEKIINQLRRGEIDIIIGTHRIVQKDVVFKDLGLCIIDEEQRFGVAHKERMKELKNSVDVLTLSATPIPRTLNMAMSGLRDMSVIEEAPMDRFPVQTYVMEQDWGVIAEALKKELRRGGQAFYLHNRIDSIMTCAAKIGNLLPEARVAVAHGRMSEDEISEVWRQLLDHEVDILVCTTIIEAGIDVPNCNTLIIENADRMGLSQLYQIRGRVGRSNRRAFAYFTFTKDKELTDVATKRLAAIRDFTSFGSGFKIAMRDLEIRGAGNILGSRQHGHMEAVGYEMYMRLLNEAIAEEKGEKPQKSTAECLVDIRLDAHIPEKYIDNTSQRIDIYKKIAGIQTREDALDVTDELIDRFGEPPASVRGLIDVAMLRNLASGLGIYEITQKGTDLLFYGDSFDIAKVSTMASKHRGRIKFNAGAKPYVAAKINAGELPSDMMRTVLFALSE
ncbi:MAG: transcription-repair coupling factor [Oscillospiraceae bacterium]|nr:transcription-repair coupling factor [Oscillospiraceae bacterium]